MDVNQHTSKQNHHNNTLPIICQFVNLALAHKCKHRMDGYSKLNQIRTNTKLRKYTITKVTIFSFIIQIETYRSQLARKRNGEKSDKVTYSRRRKNRTFFFLVKRVGVKIRREGRSFDRFISRKLQTISTALVSIFFNY